MSVINRTIEPQAPLTRDDIEQIIDERVTMRIAEAIVGAGLGEIFVAGANE